MNMTDILAAFASEPLFPASEKFLKHLGVKFSTQTGEPIPFLELYEEAAKEANATIPKDVKAIFARVENTYFIGTVTDDTLKGENAGVDFKEEAAKPKYEGMFVFAVEMKPGETLKRSEAAVLVRGINRVVRQQPATVLILEDTILSVATCERTAYKQTWRPGERLGKVSILKGVNCLSPHRGHIDILESMNVNDCATFDALYAQWQKVFSTSLLTNKFYNELFNWYVWAIDPKTDVYFPNDPDDDNDDYEGRDTKIIRLITRVMFVWFIRQKKLVPDWIFDEDYLGRILKDFNPAAADSGNYYNAVLQNLFFATLNRAIEDEDGKRRFAELQGHVDAKNLYRYDELYTISKDEIVEHFSSIPFVNGSLFECLDKTKGNDGVGKAFYYDGFSRNDHRIPATNHYRYRAFVPNNLFFDPDRGLFSIFGRYNFTIEENTPLEQQVALDPELLGKVFENLLGVYNPETKETARKQSGSFYTPREIVDYMVDETLISYLGDTKLVRNLFSESFTYNELDWSEYQAIAAKLKTVKILDPACGSGAFPVGMLNRIVEILGKLKTDRGDVFKLKRHIIENCIYGSDIQCIAAQITKLRFFISLIVNCERDEEKPNFGIPELPNLETKFVAANSLIGINKIQAGMNLFEDPRVIETTEELRQVRHDHFNANTAAKKRRLVGKDEKLRKKLADLLNGCFYQPEDAWKLALWNPYDQNTSATFFDPEWMFGIKDGFDIVIGNPPYISALDYSRFTSEEEKERLGKIYKSAKGAWDIYVLFFERGTSILKTGGTLSYITPNKYLSATYGKALRTLFVETVNIKEIVDLSHLSVFDSASVYPVITLLTKAGQSSVVKITKPASMQMLGERNLINSVPSQIMTACPDYIWGVFLSDKISLLPTVMNGSKRFDLVASINATSTAAEADEYGKFIVDSKIDDGVCLKLVNTGTIDPYVSLWGHKTLTHQKRKYLTPYLPLDQAQVNDRRKAMYMSPKIIFAKIGIRSEVFMDETGAFASLNTNCVYDPKPGYSLKFLLGLCNSRLFTVIYELLFGSLRMSGGYMQFQAPQLRVMPIPSAGDEDQQYITSRVDEILTIKKSDPAANTSELEKEIDEKVFDLYDLTPEEREIVRGNGK